MKIRLALGEQSQRYPDSFAVLSLGRKPLTYARLLSHCDRVIADQNGAGISRGDRVAVVLPNGPEMAVCFLAVAIGASCAPLNPLYRDVLTHYGAVALPCRVQDPDRKAYVSYCTLSGLCNVESWLLGTPTSLALENGILVERFV